MRPKLKAWILIRKGSLSTTAYVLQYFFGSPDMAKDGYEWVRMQHLDET